MKKTAFLCLLLAFTLLLTACTGNTPAAPSGETDATQPTLSSEEGASDASQSEQTAESTLSPETEGPVDTPSDPTEPTAATEAPPAESAAPVQPRTSGESVAFSGRFSGCDESIFGLLYNDPFPAGDPVPTVTWNEGAYGKLVIVPRYIGSTVRAYAVTMSADGRPEYAEEPTFCTALTEDGCEIGASLDRPDVFPAWYVEIELPDGRTAGSMLSFNGRYGTLPYEFITEPYASALVTEPSGMEDWTPQMDQFGYENFWAFWRAAKRAGIDPWQAGKQFFAGMTEFGAGAAFTVTEGDWDGGAYTLETARFHMAYYTADGTLAEQVAAQNALYQQIGNKNGILGYGHADDGEALYYRLTGITVYNPTLCAVQVRVTVNGTDCGVFDLASGDFCTLIPLSLPEYAADRPISVTVQVVSARNIPASSAILEVYAGLESNISNAQ